MASTAPLIEARHLRRRHPDGLRWLLNDVGVEILPGDRVAVTGPSGSGKTLLLRALALLDPLEGGEIRWRGRPVLRDRVPAFRRQAIYAHQRPALAGQTVEEVLGQPLLLRAYRDRRFQRDRVVELLERLGRDEDFLSKSPRDLSGGESQIVALVRALQLDPAVLLLDEPTAALDSQTIQAAESLLETWLAESPDSRAVVWVSHDAAQAARVASRVLHVRDGRLTEDGQRAG